MELREDGGGGARIHNSGTWRGLQGTPTDQRGYDRSGPNTVTAYVHTTDPLIARPVATMTVEAQEAHERKEKISRDD